MLELHADSGLSVFADAVPAGLSFGVAFSPEERVGSPPLGCLANKRTIIFCICPGRSASVVHNCFDDNDGTGSVIRYMFDDCIGRAPSHFVLDVLEIPDINFLLPCCGDSGELFSFQEDIRSFIFAPDLGIAISTVFLLLCLVLANKGLGAVE